MKPWRGTRFVKRNCMGKQELHLILRAVYMHYIIYYTLLLRDATKKVTLALIISNLVTSKSDVLRQGIFNELLRHEILCSNK